MRVLLFIALLFAGCTRKPVSPEKALVERYTKASDPHEKYIAGAALSMLAVLSDKSKFTAEDLAAVDRAKKEMDEISAQALKLEAALTPADVLAITKDNPASVYRVTGKYPLTGSAIKCTPELYAELIKKADIGEMYTRGFRGAAYLMAKEETFSKKYLSALSELINKDDRFKEFRTLNKTLLDRSAAEEIGKLSGLKEFTAQITIDENNEARVKRYRKQLMDTGLEEAKIDEYTLNNAKLSPECLGTVSVTFYKMLKKDFAALQLSKFAAKLKNTKLNKEDLQGNLGNARIENDVYLKSYMDPWGSPIAIVKTGANEIRLKSLGEDRKESSDDLQSAPVTIKY